MTRWVCSVEILVALLFSCIQTGATGDLTRESATTAFENPNMDHIDVESIMERLDEKLGEPNKICITSTEVRVEFNASSLGEIGKDLPENDVVRKFESTLGGFFKNVIIDSKEDNDLRCEIERYFTQVEEAMSKLENAKKEVDKSLDDIAAFLREGKSPRDKKRFELLVETSKEKVKILAEMEEVRNTKFEEFNESFILEATGHGSFIANKLLALYLYNKAIFRMHRLNRSIASSYQDKINFYIILFNNKGLRSKKETFFL